jgi:cold shock protein
MGGRREQRNMATSGTIAHLVGDRGFGFIRDERGQELFFHATSVEGVAFEELHEGQSAEFDREGDTRGRVDRAAHVRPAIS